MPFPELQALGFVAGEDSRYFNQTPGDPSMRKKFEGGFTATRPRYTKMPPRVITTGFTDIDDVSRRIFEDFWDANRGGSRFFTYVHPVSGETYQARFTDRAPRIAYAGMGGTHRWNIADIEFEAEIYSATPFVAAPSLPLIGTFNTPVEMAIFGDSYAAGGGGGALSRNDYRGALHWANIALDGRLRVRQTHQIGFTGWRIDQVATQVGLVTTLNPRPVFCFLTSLGHNDAHAGTPIADSEAAARAIVNSLLAANIMPVAGPVFPKDTHDATKVANVAAINAMWRKIADEGRLIWCDWAYLTVDSVTGLPFPGILFDLTHVGAKGAHRMGGIIATALAPYILGTARLPTADDPGMIANALNTGSVAISTGGFTGQVATGMSPYFSVEENAGTKVCSKVARTDGRPGEWQQIQISGLRTSTARIAYQSGLYHQVAHSVSGVQPGDRVEGLVEFELDAATAVNLGGIWAQIAENNGSTFVRLDWEGSASAAAGYQPDFAGLVRGVVRTPELTIRSFSGSPYLRIHFGLQGDTTPVNGFSGRARFMATIRKID